MLGWINRLYLNMSLSHKIMAMVTLMVMIPVLVIPVLVISLMFYRHLHQSIRQKVSSNYLHVVEQYKSNLRYKFYNHLLDTMIANNQFQDVLQKGRPRGKR